jgi:hypothetical protein
MAYVSDLDPKPRVVFIWIATGKKAVAAQNTAKGEKSSLHENGRLTPPVWKAKPDRYCDWIGRKTL